MDVQQVPVENEQAQLELQMSGDDPFGEGLGSDQTEIDNFYREQPSDLDMGNDMVNDSLHPMRQAMMNSQQQMSQNLYTEDASASPLDASPGELPPPEGGFDALPDPESSEDAMLKEWEIQHAHKMEKKIAEEDKHKQKVLEEAEDWLDKWHNKKTDDKLEKAATNRGDEEELQKRNDELVEESMKENPYKRVYTLIGGAQGQSSSTDSAVATTRMHDLLLNLKIKGIAQ
eukprot:CAMPEP_0185768756 /NCGR_PEP_ID=MMETSP1174-20130828/51908_1 /TAXON_ID=35687 /ORGANISM="Dictyocha speculum, Strain CCMP1381" /LENGTH=229 /DNA_ID=CAMNT_0028453587 /DNA_START=21 /DNA_END=710 /DNA_ORIENTATION=+